MNIFDKAIYGKDLEAFLEDEEALLVIKNKVDKLFSTDDIALLTGVFTVKVEWFSDEQFNSKTNKKETYKPT